MEKRRPSWKDYILAVILAVALLYAIFPIKGLLKLMTALYWRYILYGVAGGVAVSVVLYLLKKRAVIFRPCAASPLDDFARWGAWDVHGLRLRRSLLAGLHPLPCFPAVQNLKPAKNP